MTKKGLKNQSHYIFAAAILKQVSRAVIFVFVFSLFYACDREKNDCSKQGAELNRIAMEEGQLRCAMLETNKEAKRIWDDYNLLLSNSFAPSTNVSIRSKMLEMRNAELLRMFQSFDSLDIEAREALEVTERFDSLISRQMLTIQNQLNGLDKKKMRAFLWIEHQCPKKLGEYQDQYLLTMKKNCDAL